MLQTTNKMYAKNPQKYANNPQKYAKTRKSNQFAISALFIVDMDITRQNFCFGGLTNQSFSCTIRAIQGANKRLILYSRLGTQMHMHVTMHQSLLPVWRYDMTWYDMIWHDMTCLAQIQWYHDMVWKNLFNFVLERSVLAGNGKNGPNVQLSKRTEIMKLLKVQEVS